MLAIHRIVYGKYLPFNLRNRSYLETNVPDLRLNQ
jgi:hypothetical protein